MGRMYTVPMSEVAVSAAQDLWELSLPTDLIVKIHEVQIAQGSDTDSEMAAIAFYKGVGSTSGSGGSTPTPVPHETSMTASSVTVEMNNTTVATAGGGSLTLIWASAFNVLNGFHYLPTPETQFTLSPGEEFYVRLKNAPADALTMSGFITYEELGG